MIGLKRIETANVQYLGLKDKSFYFRSQFLDFVVNSRNRFFPYKMTEDRRFLIISETVHERPFDRIIELETLKEKKTEPVISYFSEEENHLLSEPVFATRRGFFFFNSERRIYSDSTAIFLFRDKEKNFFFHLKAKKLFLNDFEIESFRLWRSPTTMKFQFRYMKDGQVFGPSFSKDELIFQMILERRKPILKNFFQKTKIRQFFERGFFLSDQMKRIKFEAFDEFFEKLKRTISKLKLPIYFANKLHYDPESDLTKQICLDLDSRFSDVNEMIELVESKFKFQLIEKFESTSRGHYHVLFELPRAIRTSMFEKILFSLLDILYQKRIFVDTISRKPNHPFFVAGFPVFIK